MPGSRFNLDTVLVGQGRSELAVGADWDFFKIFSRFSHLLFLPLSGRWPDINFLKLGPSKSIVRNKLFSATYPLLPQPPTPVPCMR